MADSSVPVTAGSGTSIDTRTESTNSNHRQVIVVGDPSTNAAVAAVLQDAPSTSDYGMVVLVHPDSQNANGQAAAASSTPVVVAKNSGTGSTISGAAIGTAGTASAEVVTVQGVASMTPILTTATDAGGTIAHDGAASAINPILFGGYASAAAPTDVSADTDAVRAWFLRNGSQVATINGGMVAHDAADANNPIKIGLKATTSLAALTLVADADRTNAFAGVDGVQITRPHCNLEDIVSGNATNTDGTSTACIAAQSAGIKTYLTSVVLCNTSATAITVDIKDGSTVKVSLPLPAGSGCIYNPPVPIPGTAATAWNFDGSAAATTVTCSMVGFKSKV